MTIHKIVYMKQIYTVATVDTILIYKINILLYNHLA